jgi:NAD(P)H-hydrate epimerase
VAVTPDYTLTLALPKMGLADASGDIALADIAVPATVYDRVGIEYESPFEGRYRVPIRAVDEAL